MSLAMVQMKDFMKQKGGNPDVVIAPIKAHNRVSDLREEGRQILRGLRR